jgi:hypothetical protein
MPSWVLSLPEAHGKEVRMSRISRRTMLAGSAALGTTVDGMAVAEEQEPSRELSTLIEAHEAAYRHS